MADRRTVQAAAARGGSRLNKGWAVFAAAAVLAAAFLLSLGTGLGFFYDEWWFVTERIPWSAHSFLEPHHEHLSLLPVLVYKLLFETVGLNQYTPFRVIGVLVHVTCVALVFAYARRRIGDVLALALAMPLLVLSAGSDDVLWPFQIGFVGSLGTGIGALLLLDRMRPGWAFLLLCASLACSGIGVTFLIVIAVESLSASRQERLVAGGALALYALWYLIYGQTQSGWGDVSGIPGWIADSVHAGVQAIAPVGGVAAAIAAGILGAALLVGIARRPSRRLIALATGTLVTWALIALGRDHLTATGYRADLPRYTYVAAVLVALLVSELARGRQVRSRGVAYAVFAAAALATAVNAGRFPDAVHHLEDAATESRIAVAAVQLTPARSLSNDPHAMGETFPVGFARKYPRARAAYDSSGAYNLSDIHALPGGPPQLDTWLVRIANIASAEPTPCERPTRPVRDERRVPVRGVRLVATRAGARVVLRRYSGSAADAPALDLLRGHSLVLKAAAMRPPWRYATSPGVRACSLT